MVRRLRGKWIGGRDIGHSEPLQLQANVVARVPATLTHRSAVQRASCRLFLPCCCRLHDGAALVAVVRFAGYARLNWPAPSRCNSHPCRRRWRISTPRFIQLQPSSFQHQAADRTADLRDSIRTAARWQMPDSPTLLPLCGLVRWPRALPRRMRCTSCCLA